MSNFERGKFIIIPAAVAAFATAAFFGLKTNGAEKTHTTTPTALGSDAFIGPVIPEITNTQPVDTLPPPPKRDTKTVYKNGEYCESYTVQIQPDELRTMPNYHQDNGFRDTYDVDLYQDASRGDIAIRVGYLDEPVETFKTINLYPYNPLFSGPEIPTSAHAKISEHGGTAEFVATEPSYGRFMLAAEFCGPAA